MAEELYQNPLWEGINTGENMMTKRRTAVCGSVILFFSLLLVVAIPTVRAQAILYDGFNGPDLDATKWTADQSGSGGLEIVRTVTKGKRLLLAHRVVGNVNTNTGLNNSANRLRFATHRGFHSIRFKVNVTEVDVQGCDAVNTTAAGRVGFFGAYFSDSVGTVSAFLFARRESDSTDAPNLLRVTGNVTHCTDAECSSGEDLGTVDLGTMPIGVNTALSLRWDEANNRFIFRKNLEPIQSISYTLPVVVKRQGRTLSVGGEVPNCRTAPRPFAKISTFLDSVMIVD